LPWRVESRAHMKDSALHLRTLEDLERTSIPGLVEVLREEGIDAVRYALWDATGWHRGYSSPAWRHQATAEQAGQEGLGDRREDREDHMYGPARGPRAADRGDYGYAVR
jgi:hypothetical protein